jgi:hypothetical protein
MLHPSRFTLNDSRLRFMLDSSTSLSLHSFFVNVIYHPTLLSQLNSHPNQKLISILFLSPHHKYIGNARAPFSLAMKTNTTLLKSTSARSSSSTALHDTMPDSRPERSVPIYWFNEIPSTMDMAKQIVRSPTSKGLDIFGVVTDVQTKGRGTNGRVWVSGIFMVIMSIL